VGRLTPQVREVGWGLKSRWPWRCGGRDEGHGNGRGTGEIEKGPRVRSSSPGRCVSPLSPHRHRTVVLRDLGSFRNGLPPEVEDDMKAEGDHTFAREGTGGSRRTLRPSRVPPAAIPWWDARTAVILDDWHGETYCTVRYVPCTPAPTTLCTVQGTVMSCSCPTLSDPRSLEVLDRERLQRVSSPRHELM